MKGPPGAASPTPLGVDAGPSLERGGDASTRPRAAEATARPGPNAIRLSRGAVIPRVLRVAAGSLIERLNR
jgi:hypothetical protein